MTFYLLTGIMISVLLFSVKNRLRPSTVFIIACIAIVILPILVEYILPGRKSLGGEAWYESKVFYGIIAYLLMLLGMLMSVLSKSIEKRKARIDKCKSQDEKKNIKLEIEFYDLLYPFIASFLTFSYYIYFMT